MNQEILYDESCSILGDCFVGTDEQDLISMDDWPQNEKDMIQLDDGPLALHNFLQPYSIAVTNAWFDILPLFTQRSRFGSNTLICPDELLL